MKVYVMVLEDRHTDVDVEIFSNKEDAVNVARETAKDYCRFDGDYKERQVADWVFYAEYSCEGDSITVREKKLDEYSKVQQLDK